MRLSENVKDTMDGQSAVSLLFEQRKRSTEYHKNKKVGVRYSRNEKSEIRIILDTTIRKKNRTQKNPWLETTANGKECAARHCPHRSAVDKV